MYLFASFCTLYRDRLFFATIFESLFFFLAIDFCFPRFNSISNLQDVWNGAYLILKKTGKVSSTGAGKVVVFSILQSCPGFPCFVC